MKKSTLMSISHLHLVQSRLERVLRILLLLCNRPQWSCLDLINVLDVSRSGLLADIELLRAAGFSIVSQIDHDEKYFEMSPALSIASLPSEEEYLALMLAIQHCEDYLSPAEHSALERLLEKLTAMTPKPACD